MKSGRGDVGERKEEVDRDRDRLSLRKNQGIPRARLG